MSTSLFRFSLKICPPLTGSCASILSSLIGVVRVIRDCHYRGKIKYPIALCRVVANSPAVRREFEIQLAQIFGQ